MIILISTKGFGQCIVAKNALDKAGIEYKKVLADTEGGSRIVDKYDIRNVPALIIESAQSAEIYRNLPSILTYVMNHRANETK